MVDVISYFVLFLFSLWGLGVQGCLGDFVVLNHLFFFCIVICQYSYVLSLSWSQGSVLVNTLTSCSKQIDPANKDTTEADINHSRLNVTEYILLGFSMHLFTYENA